MQFSEAEDIGDCVPRPSVEWEVRGRVAMVENGHHSLFHQYPVPLTVMVMPLLMAVQGGVPLTFGIIRTTLDQLSVVPRSLEVSRSGASLLVIHWVYGPDPLKKPEK